MSQFQKTAWPCHLILKPQISDPQSLLHIEIIWEAFTNTEAEVSHDSDLSDMACHLGFEIFFKTSSGNSNVQPSLKFIALEPQGAGLAIILSEAE